MESAISATAQSIGLRDRRTGSGLSDVVAHLREQQVLIIFDNAEHLDDIAPLIAELLTGAPRLSAMVTSRRSLHLRNEREWPVRSLSLPPARHASFDQIASSEAVRLFVERASQAVPGFALDPGSAPLVAAICSRLDGLPLAIELAAARLRLFTVAQLLERLEQNLTLLTGGSADAPSRQRALRETIAWSVDLLSAADKSLFRRLAVFTSGFTLEAAEAVAVKPSDSAADRIDLFDGLSTLVDNNLVVRGQTATGDVRFSMLATILSFARELLQASEESDEMQHRHVTWCVDLSHQLGFHFEHQHASVAWMNRTQVELPNLRAALARSRATGQDEAYMRIAGNMAMVWSAIDAPEAWAILDKAPPPEATSDIALRAHLLKGIESTRPAWEMGLDTWTALLEQLGTLYDELADRHGQAYVWLRKSYLLGMQRQYAAAEAAAEQALAIWREAAQSDWITYANISAGAMAFLQHDLQRAVVFHDRAAVANFAAGDPAGSALSRMWLAILAAAEAKPEEARSQLLQGLNHLQEIGANRESVDWIGSAICVLAAGEEMDKDAWLIEAALRLPRKQYLYFTSVLLFSVVLPDMQERLQIDLGKEAYTAAATGADFATVEQLQALLEEKVRRLAKG